MVFCFLLTKGFFRFLVAKCCFFSVYLRFFSSLVSTCAQFYIDESCLFSESFGFPWDTQLSKRHSAFHEMLSFPKTFNFSWDTHLLMRYSSFRWDTQPSIRLLAFFETLRFKGMNHLIPLRCRPVAGSSFQHLCYLVYKKLVSRLDIAGATKYSSRSFPAAWEISSVLCSSSFKRNSVPVLPVRQILNVPCSNSEKPFPRLYFPGTRQLLLSPNNRNAFHIF